MRGFPWTHVGREGRDSRLRGNDVMGAGHDVRRGWNDVMGAGMT